MPEYVHLPGFRQDAVNFYAMADAGILPTRFKGESFPLTIIECFMAGNPVIATDVGEVRNMMTSDDGNVAGFVVGLEENGHIPVSEFAAHLASLASDAVLYNEKRLLAEALAPRFEMSRVLDDYEGVYNAVIGAGAAQGASSSAEPASGDAEAVIRKSA